MRVCVWRQATSLPRPLVRALAVVVTLATPALAQDTVSVFEGSVIRVRRQVDARWQKGAFVGVTRDSLRLLPCSECSLLSLPRGDVAAVQVRVAGEGPSPVAIALSGLVGTAIGAGITALVVAHDERNCRDGPCGIGYVLVVPLGAAAGMVVGLVAGASMRFDSWHPARL